VPSSTKTPPKRGLCTTIQLHVEECSTSLSEAPAQCTASLFAAATAFLRQREFQHAVVVLGLGRSLRRPPDRARTRARSFRNSARARSTVSLFLRVFFRASLRRIPQLSLPLMVMLISSFLTPGNSADTRYSLSFSVTSMRILRPCGTASARGRTRLRVRQPHGDATDPVLECILERIKTV